MQACPGLPLRRGTFKRSVFQIGLHMIPVFASRFLHRSRQISREHATVFKAISFGLIGFVNTAIDLGVFSFAYYVIGLPIVVSNLTSWLFAVSSSYFLNSMITFAAESGRELSSKKFAIFIIAQLAGFAANTAAVFIASYFMAVLLGKLLATLVSFLVNFSLSHFVVFRKSAGDV